MPASIIANMFGFKLKEYFQTDEESKATPKVQF
jgi:LemA protein